MKIADGLTTHRSLAQRYAGLAEAGQISRDPRQIEVARALDRLLDEIVEKRLAAKKSALGWLFAKRMPREPVKGLYITAASGAAKRC
jgi:cell division protein ZapE